MTTSYRRANVRVDNLEASKTSIRLGINPLVGHLLQRIVVYNIENKQLTTLDKGIDQLDSTSALEFKNDWICAAHKGFAKESSLVRTVQL